MRKGLPRPAYLERVELPEVVEPLPPPIDLPPGKPGAWVRNGRVVAVTDDYAGKAPPVDMIFLPYSQLQVGDAYIAPAPLAPLNIDDVLELIGHFMPDKPALSEPHNFPANMTDKLSDWDTVPDEASLTTADLLDLMRTDAVSAEDVVQKFTKVGRKRFTELLNVELAELQQERGGPRENLAREAECERLLDLFARVGSM